MHNYDKYNKTPYGDNLVARCDNCGKPIFKCTCDDEDYEDEEETAKNKKQKGLYATNS